jgi:hypothetical protein
LPAIPPPFDRFIEINPDQRLLDCWRGIFVRLTPEGRIDTLVGFRRYARGVFFPHVSEVALRHDPDPTQGLLILTDKGIVHCRLLVHPTAAYDQAREAQVDLKIPHTSVLAADVRQYPAVPRPLLLVQVEGDAAAFSPQFVEGQYAGTGDVHFLCAPEVNLPQVVSEIREAGGQAGSPGMPVRPPPSSSEDGIINFHAEEGSE